jgi:hypothetical protein
MRSGSARGGVVSVGLPGLGSFIYPGELSVEVSLDGRGDEGDRLSSRRSHHGPQPGDAAPDVPAVNLHHTLARASGQTALYIAKRGDTPQPITAGDIQQHVLVTDAEAPTSGFNKVIPDPDRSVASRYGTGDKGGLFVIRPDGYIASRSKQR